MLSPLQKKTAQAIVNIFETSHPLGDYGNVTVMSGDTGHLTYGRSQTTLASGNLALLLHSYCAADGALAGALEPWLPAFDARDFALDRNEEVKSLLRQAGADPVMRQTQDEFFDRVYWTPAESAATTITVQSALGVTVVYDSTIHGSFRAMRDRTDQEAGSCPDIGELRWIESYIAIRRQWLSTHANVLLHKTVYRMDALHTLLGNWDLTLPIMVRGIEISETVLNDPWEPAFAASAAGIEDRVLMLSSPFMRGADVQRLQNALRLPQPDADGIFGPRTDSAVRAFQKERGLTVDGKVGKATWAALQA